MTFYSAGILLTEIFMIAMTVHVSIYNGFSKEQKKIMRNLPFAYRGYIFKNKELDTFFKTTEWYIPNPSYDGNMEALNEEEKRWVEYWSK